MCSFGMYALSPGPTGKGRDCIAGIRHRNSYLAGDQNTARKHDDRLKVILMFVPVIHNRATSNDDHKELAAALKLLAGYECKRDAQQAHTMLVRLTESDRRDISEDARTVLSEGLRKDWFEDRKPFYQDLVALASKSVEWSQRECVVPDLDTCGPAGSSARRARVLLHGGGWCRRARHVVGDHRDRRPCCGAGGSFRAEAILAV